MKQNLQLRLKQQLSITPQLQQAIKLLQLSSLDLITEIQQAVESNPLLEFEENFSEPPSEPSTEDLTKPADTADSEYLADLENAAYVSASEDTSWSSRTNSNNSFTDSDRTMDYPESNQHLHSHLAAQINVIALSDTDRLIADSIIDSINEDGYLEFPPEEIHASYPDSMEITLEEVLAVLNMIQHLDPPGVGARNIQDSLRIQLLQDTPSRSFASNTALQIITNHLEL